VLPGLTLLALLTACDPKPPATPPPAPLADGLFTPADLRQLKKMARLSPPPVVDPTNPVHDDPRAQLLGQRLFFDRGLSANGKISCASCHGPDTGFSVQGTHGMGLVATDRHPPTLLNVAYQQFFDWDGKADSLWMQAMRPLESPGEHGISRVFAVRHVIADAELSAAYQAIFGALPDLSDVARAPDIARPDPDAPDGEAHQRWLAMDEADRQAVDAAYINLTRSLAAYQARLVNAGSPFDRYASALVEGRVDTTYDAQAKQGLKLFLGKGQCVVCHNGPLLSDMAFHNIGSSRQPDEGRWVGVPHLKQSPYNTLGAHSAALDGERAQRTRYLTRTPEDHGQLRTPSLRNIAQTAPYMHFGQLATLEEVVTFYSELPHDAPVGHREDFLKPAHLTPAEQAALVAFLKTLNGQPLDPFLLHPPASLEPAAQEK
jgi:cytochrome c peroxidase